ncbi:unnamed protein product [Orchesella dallaii]|uniref:C2H2-type domain-containing protein n=1 Tax=Orchesella dallaii TaxID=48710 RepID=A0ABP1Q174_9HEXA
MKLRSRSATKPKASPFIKSNSSNVTRKSNPIPSSSSAATAIATPSTSRGTFASTLSACWNTNNATATASTSFRKPGTSIMASGSNQQRQTPNKTTCLLCPNVVLLSHHQNFSSNIRRHKLLINLCKHLEISADEIPGRSHCTKINFPFCTNCESMVVDLWKQQQILDEVNLKIQKLVGDIEHVVVDAEILGPSSKRPGSSSMAEAEQRKSTKLRDLILEGYRSKLLRKHQKDNDPNVVRPEVIEPSALDIKRELFEQADGDADTDNFTSSAPSTEAVNEDSIESDYDEDEDCEELPPPLTRQDITAPYNDDDGDDIGNDDEEQTQSFPEGEETEESERFVWSVDPGVVARYNDSNCTMVITNENAETGATSLIQVKQERIAAAVAEYDDGDDADSDQDEGDIFALAERKRRFLFEGVEIFRATGTRSKVDYLQCSLCSYMLPIKKYNTSKVSSPYMKMKTHILHVHKRKSGVPKQPRARQLSCIPCNINFSNLAELRVHKAQHPPSSSFECSICGKPFKKGSSQYNLLIHKFSHKNDDERKVALAAGERGSYNCMLSTKLNMALLAGKAAVPRRRKKPVIKTGNVNRSSAPAAIDRYPSVNESDYDGNGRPFKCQVCRRVFGRKCHLMRHMSSHTQVGSILDQPIPSTSTGNREGARRRQTIGAEPVRAALPLPPPPVHSNLVNSSVIGDSGSGMNTSFDRGQRVAVGDGTVVIVKREVLELLMNN